MHVAAHVPAGAGIRRGSIMRGRQLIGSATYAPDTLKVLFKAFDDAWHELAPAVGTSPLAIEATRLRLANVILSLAGPHSDNAEQLKNAALRIMAPDSRP
jgi:hypothetical protein